MARQVMCSCGVLRSEAEIWNHIEVFHEGDDSTPWRVVDSYPPPPNITREQVSLMSTPRLRSYLAAAGSFGDAIADMVSDELTSREGDR